MHRTHFHVAAGAKDARGHLDDHGSRVSAHEAQSRLLTREHAMVELEAQWLSTVTVHSHIVTTHSQIKLSYSPFIVATVKYMPRAAE